jgi:hypothetical protein
MEREEYDPEETLWEWLARAPPLTDINMLIEDLKKQANLSRKKGSVLTQRKTSADPSTEEATD